MFVPELPWKTVEEGKPLHGRMIFAMYETPESFDDLKIHIRDYITMGKVEKILDDGITFITAIYDELLPYTIEKEFFLPNDKYFRYV